MVKFTDLTGQKFSRLTVVGRVDNGKNGRARWHCQCECGGTTVTDTYKLNSGHTQSCGCVQIERITRHGMHNSPEYSSWEHIIQRCTNPNNEGYMDYGGRGIKIYDRWKEFENFYKDMGARPKGTSIDRIDVNGDYGPENCRWSTEAEQKRNTRNTRMITYDNKTQCLTDWANDIGMSVSGLRKRLSLGWSTERALTEGVADNGS